VARIASEAIIERLADWGVDTVFGIPRDGINDRKATIATTLFKDKIEQLKA
jgi:thiamine pyrophosphate-dependent acetolactate synthase large subunit-like protein